MEVSGVSYRLLLCYEMAGGGSGIRTHVGVTLTCFQDMRLKPLGHPSERRRFYHKLPDVEVPNL